MAASKPVEAAVVSASGPGSGRYQELYLTLYVYLILRTAPLVNSVPFCRADGTGLARCLRYGDHTLRGLRCAIPTQKLRRCQPLTPTPPTCSSFPNMGSVRWTCVLPLPPEVK